MSEQQTEIIQDDLQEEVFEEYNPQDEMVEIAPNKFVSKGYAEQNNIALGEEKPKEEAAETTIEEKPIETKGEEKPIEEAKVETIVEEKPIVEEKKIDPYEALGLTEEAHKEYLKKVAEAIKTNTLDELIQNMSMNFDRMNEYQLLEYEMSNKIKSEYPTISEKALKAAVQKETDKILAEFDVNSDDDEQAEVGLELFKLRMDKIREGFKQKQSEYQPPKYEQKVAAIDPQIIEQQQKAEQARNEFVAEIEKSPFIQEVERTKVVSFGDFKMDVPQSFNAKEQTINVNAFLSKFFDANGKLDEQRWIKAMAFGENPDKAAEDLINYGKSIKEKESFDAMRGIKNTDTALPNSDADNPYKIGRIRHTGQN